MPRKGSHQKRSFPAVCASCGIAFLGWPPTPSRPAPKYCSVACAKEPLKIPLDVKLWKSVDKRGPGDCWEWIGYRMRFGYGQMNHLGQNLHAHRVSWELHNGPIPEGMHICHTCDNPPCVNPAHLFLGTARDNMQDAARKGRLPRPRPARGAANGNSTLTEAQAREILQRVGEPHRALAREYGVSPPTIARIRHRETWKHIV